MAAARRADRCEAEVLESRFVCENEPAGVIEERPVEVTNMASDASVVKDLEPSRRSCVCVCVGSCRCRRPMQKNKMEYEQLNLGC